VTQEASGSGARPRRGPVADGRSGPWAATAVLVIVLACAGHLPAAAQDTSPPAERSQVRVLLLYAEPRLLPSVVQADQAVRATLQSGSPQPVYFYTEYLDLSLFDGDVPPRELHELLRRKYAGRALDLIIAVTSRALRIAVRYRAELFGGAPIVFFGVDRKAGADIELGDDITGVWLRFGWDGTLEAALRLQPEIRRVVIVTGSSPVDRVTRAAAQEQLQAYQGHLDIRYVHDLAVEEIRRQVASLPAGTVVLTGAFLRDATGRDFTSLEVVESLARVSPVPVYTLNEQAVGLGTVGGYVLSFEAQGRTAAELALKVLRGERPAPIVTGTHLHAFDWRQLKRWRLDERRLPPGSKVLFRVPSTWERYRWWIAGGATVLLIQTALILGLVVQGAHRRRSRHALAARLRFETLLSELSASFLTIPPADMDQQIEGALRLVVEELDVDRGSLVELTAGGDEVRLTHSWARPGIDSIRARLERRTLPWMFSRFDAGHVVRLSRPGDLPEDAAADREALVDLGTRSLVAIPIQAGGSTLGILVFDAIQREREWPDDLIPRFRLLGEIFANALARRRAEQAAQESEARFRLMADSAPVMVWVAGPDGRSTYFNPPWLDFTGRRLEDELDNGWIEGIHADDRARCLTTFRSALVEHRGFTMEYRLRRRDGEYRWVLDQGVPRISRDGELTGYIGSCIDVTALRAARQTLAETDSLRSAIFGSLYGRVAALDRHGVIVAANEAWTGANGGGDGPRPAAAVGTSYLDLCRREAADGDPVARACLDAVLSVLDGGRRHARHEYARTSPAGEQWFEITVAPLRGADGGVVVSHVDITRRRQAEEEVQREREQLAHVLRVTTLGELAGSLAHELNQPLAAILSNAQASRRLLEAGNPDVADVREALADIGADAKRASEVIRRLRALFRRDHPERQRVDVHQLIRDVADLLRTDLHRKRVTLVYALADHVPPIAGDAVQLQQVVLNLLVNAGEALAEQVDGPRDIIITTSCRDGGRVKLAIRDSGAGVKEGDLERIFQHFVSTKPGGLGMGLAISRSIVQSHGGRIWATANADRGLTLHVELPAEAAEAPGR
jgi:two-component system, LuxR family, sensor kinase FixL